jgi:hypothetical protein
VSGCSHWGPVRFAVIQCHCTYVCTGPCKSCVLCPEDSHRLPDMGGDHSSLQLTTPHSPAEPGQPRATQDHGDKGLCFTRGLELLL